MHGVLTQIGGLKGVEAAPFSPMVEVTVVSLADVGVGAVAVGLPLAPVVAEGIAGLKGFRSLFAAESTGLVVDRLCRAGGGGFQVLFCDFLCKAVCV